MVRDLVENAIALVRDVERKKVRQEAETRVTERLLDMLAPRPVTYTSAVSISEEDRAEKDEADSAEKHYERTRGKMKAMLEAGELEERKVEMVIEHKAKPMLVTGMGLEQMESELQGMFEKILPKHTSRRELTVREAREVLLEQESDALLDPDKINEQAIHLAENRGMIFLDEIDKVVASDGKGADVSRQGVQRDLLPIVEGTTVQTRYGYIKTDHILFVAAGAFHRNKPSELMPELQGRFPIRVELKDLTKDDFVRSLREPRHSLTRQYADLLQTEGVTIEFTDDAIEALATYAHQVNQSTQNIGARRLYTIMERLLEELSFEAPDMKTGKVPINAAYVSQRLKDVAGDEDLSKFIL
jgi:ATP-dependent HslUV protease ATP-binding subunit HslU